MKRYVFMPNRDNTDLQLVQAGRPNTHDTAPL